MLPGLVVQEGPDQASVGRRKSLVESCGISVCDGELWRQWWQRCRTAT
ncbi:hypothetical protein HMPREF9621_02531 [Cutibacterium modestum HL037PA2]|nr:hypothetical protein HMPREF9621_02531 [Cutibacterium modestum HL037PA2]